VRVWKLEILLEGRSRVVGVESRGALRVVGR
jgi:hypothetical protein